LSSDPLIGTQVGPYRVESRIGGGGMGSVYLVEHTVLEHQRALKVLNAAHATDEGFRARFLREARLPAALEHASILPIHDAGESDGLLYIVMPYVRGADLQTLIDEAGRMEPADVVAILSPIASALDTAHAAGLLHRDVKPANILIAGVEAGSSRRVYLSDFGLVKSVVGGDAVSTDTGTLMGTMPYVAPEIWRGEPLDGRVDQYALACTLFYAVTGQLPFGNAEPVVMMYRHLQEPVPSVTERQPSLPHALDDVTRRGMAKDRDERFPDCAAMVRAAWAPLGHELPLPPDERTAFVRSETGMLIDVVADRRSAGVGPRRPKLKLAAAGAAVAAAVAVALAVWALAGPGDPPGRGAGRTGVQESPGASPSAPADREPFVPAAATAQIPGTKELGDIAVGEAGVWFTDAELSETDSGVVRIDPATNQLADKFRVALHGPSLFGLAVSEDAVWVGNSQLIGDTRLMRIDAASGEVDAEIVMGFGDSLEIAVGGGFVWAGGGTGASDNLVRVDAVTNDVQTFTVNGFSGRLTFGSMDLWAVAQRGTLVRVDPETLEPTQNVQIGRRIDDVFVDDGTVWLVMQAGQALERVDEETGEILEPFPVGTEVRDAVMGLGSLWVVFETGETEQGDFAVHRFDPVSGDALEEVPLDSIAISVTSDEQTGSIWVTVLTDNSKVTRVELVE